MAGKRITFYISENLDNNLILLSKRMGISKSVLVDRLLEVPTQQLVDLLNHLPESPGTGEVLRFRGNSMKLIDSHVAEMREVLREV